ncbi:hypothetical protein CcaCcLH18_10124 [Colletotrichum camelliae]|nr:hypothetical protein CcaCcLH18_10124 [Colletotrichum camelliae]
MSMRPGHVVPISGGESAALQGHSDRSERPENAVHDNRDTNDIAFRRTTRYLLIKPQFLRLLIHHIEVGATLMTTFSIDSSLGNNDDHVAEAAAMIENGDEDRGRPGAKI